MKIPIVIEPGTETTAFGVAVPDLPGCFSAGDTLEQAIDNAREAIELWCKAVNEDGDLLPVTKTLAEHQADPRYAGWIWTEVEMPFVKGFIEDTWAKEKQARSAAFSRQVKLGLAKSTDADMFHGAAKNSTVKYRNEDF
jgi:predicted RNase H-like HicB family nuclease